ncbi:SMI1/KNR4 family protein [Paenibacillus massiliensis]|uniref:SMI1/KNR4 family protein n=1 Tax=Paenibacillus massiliensis TaxID=225917 RepID=UPI00041FCD94|nr:SMI1/KNR4 family protein [Paenibacillus massiliensis]
MQEMDKLIAQLDTLLQEKAQDPEIREMYEDYVRQSGASEHELIQFEKDFGIRLPEDFRTFYRQKNGSGYHFHVLYPGKEQPDARYSPFYLMSLDEMREVKTYFCSEDEPLEQYFTPEEIAELEPELQPFLSHSRWFPFATMAGGSLYLMLDFYPSEQGTLGQIICYVHDPDFIYYIAPSFSDMLRDSNRNLGQKTAIEY